MKKKNTHGGKRAGAGRKKLESPMATYSVRITHAQAALLKAWGGGDLSAGLRWLVDAAEILVARTRPDKSAQIGK